MRKEIGSNFWINKDFFRDKTYNINNILGDLKIHNLSSSFFSTCRQGIRFCLQDISPGNKVALLPEFTCHSVIDPFLKEGFELKFYPVNKDLSVSSSSLNMLIDTFNVSVLLIHPYFGFDTLTVDEKLNDKIKVIFDQTQSLYSDFSYDFPEYIVGSLRKWAGLLDGAFVAKKGTFNLKCTFPVDQALEEKMLEASHLKSLYMEEDLGNKEIFLRLYAEGLSLIRSNNDLNNISEKSLIVQDNLDINTLKKSRRDNFCTLLNFDWLRVGKPVFTSLERDVTPLYFPIYLKVNRELFQKYLAKNNIYAPIIWTKPAYFINRDIDLTTQWIYQHIICIPIDQRYDDTDMNRVKQVVSLYEAEQK